MNKYLFTGKRESGKSLLAKMITNKDETIFLDGKQPLNTTTFFRWMQHVSTHKPSIDTICMDDFMFDKNFHDLEDIINKFPKSGIFTLIINTEEELNEKHKSYFDKNNYQVVDINDIDMNFIMTFLDFNSIYLK